MNTLSTDAVQPVIDIVLVDDDSMVSGCLSALLRREGYSVREFENGRLALQFLNTHAARLIITDILMPEIDGLEFITHLRKHRRESSIVAMSGTGIDRAELLLKTARFFGVKHTFSKPVEIGEFLKVARAELGPGKADACASTTSTPRHGEGTTPTSV